MTTTQPAAECGTNVLTCALKSGRVVVQFYGKYNTPERLQRSDVSSPETWFGGTGHNV
jgi:hypothetical protein